MSDEETSHVVVALEADKTSKWRKLLSRSSTGLLHPKKKETQMEKSNEQEEEEWEEEEEGFSSFSLSRENNQRWNKRPLLKHIKTETCLSSCSC